jgi:uncharacterized protein (TIGR02271 family)
VDNPSPDPRRSTIVVPVAEEQLIVTRRRRVTGGVRVRVTAEATPREVTETVQRRVPRIERVPVNKKVLAMPEPRREGDVLVVPLVEEVLVTERRLILREELRIHIDETSESITRTLVLHAEQASIERLPPEPEPLPTLAPWTEEPDMSHMITGVFDSRTQAEQAAEDLAARCGVGRDQIRIFDDSSTSTTAQAQEDRGFWGSLRDLFVPDDERTTYTEAIRRGGFVVSAQVPEHAMDAAMDVLEAHGAVDLDQREESWRREGWSGTATGTATATSGHAAMAVGDTVVNPTGAAAARTEATHGATGTHGLRHGQDEVVQLAEEQIRVGKRVAERGRVRVRTYVVETPVQEDVTLRSEHVEIERRPVDREITGDDRNLFQERVIEATETAEEAVVAKQARVREEVRIHKDVEERTETVRDTVRRTELEVDDERQTGGTMADDDDTLRRPATDRPMRGV